MMIEWMAYATLLTAFICCAAAAGEHAMAIWRGGRRFVWLAALIIATVIPTVLSVRRPSVTARAPTVGTQSLSPEVQRFTFDNASRAKRPSLISLAARSLVTIDPYFRGAWIAASLILLSLFARATIGLRRQRSQWREIDLAGERLLLAPDAGPAVVGVLHPQVVVPHWALLLDPTARTLMLRHEAEHIRARDPQLLVVAALALVLFPWNAGLWFVVRRMRLAIEVDCDERVLRGSEHAREYGLLLLTVGARHSA
ncbi:MAG TPA: M56 family metallopeptidase, partial [Gemmatimonadaceae bacterium]|nr:M56 family metallopeptidase [Gemmatimonadaceae bacterium]